MQAEKTDLTRAVVAYLVALGFAVTFLLSMVFGAGLGTCLFRGIIAGLATHLMAPWLVRPVLATVFDAIARHQSESVPAQPEDEA